MAATVPPAQTSDAGRQVPTRRIAFDAAFQTVPKHFAADGDLIGSHVVAGLSALFPDGEDYFVRSVRRFRDQVTDPELKRQVAGFIGQEAVHGREHRAFNDRLAELGYPVKAVEWLTRMGLRARERITTPKANLAATAALEHFTATIAEVVLTSEETRDGFGHEEVRNLFVWHALEESEHKAVAFDLYRVVGGSERTRRWTMRAYRYAFVIGMAVQVAASLLFDRSTYRPRVLRQSWRRLVESPMASTAVWEQLKDYERPDFHPDDRDTTELIAQWRAKLFGESGTLNDKLAHPAI